ncbi:MAG: hypothetical protein ACJ798_16215 [Phenylobacterium sp.]
MRSSRAGVGAHRRARRFLRGSASPGILASVLVAAAGLPGAAFAQALATAPAEAAPPSADDLRRLRQEFEALKAEEAQAKAAEQDRARRIDALGRQLGGVSPPAVAPDIQTIPAQQAEAAPPAKWGGFEPGKGVIVVRSDIGEVDLGLVSYLRYLNQHGLDKTYTDAFGRVRGLTPREDFQLAKVQITLRGWLFDPRFGYNAYVWTSQTSQGLGAQVVAAGNINWTFSEALKVYFGIHSIPSTRSTNRTFPIWLRNDNRPIADEFFRGSYTQGIWAEGKLAKGLEYRVMVANNLSALGVNAGQLDAKPNTWSGALTWMPTTGEFGPGAGFGDFEDHQKVATLFSAHFSRSTEDPQSQPNTESIENTQLRLSDGTLLFAENAFNTPGKITEARYRMMALDAAVKYRGYALEFEYYSRWLDHFRVEGFVPVTDLYDSGFQLQASAMLIPKKLMLYLSGSKIFGQYGDPYDVALGVNWYPLDRRDLRVNVMGLWVDHSPVGYTAYPLPVGGNGFTLVSDFSLAF